MYKQKTSSTIFSPAVQQGSQIHLNFQPTDEIFQQEKERFQQQAKLFFKKPQSGGKPSLKPIQRRRSVCQTIEKPSPQQTNQYLRTASMRISCKRRKSVLSCRNYWHKMSPTKQKKYIRNAKNHKNLRCSGLKSLIDACNNIEMDSKNIHDIQKEQQLMRTWSTQLESAVGILRNIQDCESEILKQLYYFNKHSQIDIVNDMMQMKKNASPSRHTKGLN